MKTCIPILILALYSSCQGQSRDAQVASAQSAVIDTIEFRVGDEILKAEINSYKDQSAPFMIVLHADEKAAVEAGREVLAERGGTLIRLLNNTERHLSVRYEGITFLVDPNRIFTDAGIRKNLKLLNNNYPESLVARLHEFGQFLLKQIPENEIIIALHNNTEGDYSVRSYLDGGENRGDALQVLVNPELEADDFYFVTTEELYRGLKRKNVNLVWQDNENVIDDGSLSVWCGKNRRSYVNIETEESQVARQVAMIREFFAR